MPFTVPRTTADGRLLAPVAKDALAPGQHCLICKETDQAKYDNCLGDCYPTGPYRIETEPGAFTVPRPLVSAFDLARRMRAKALRLEWEQDDERDALLTRARALEKGDSAEVPDEEF